MEGYYWWFDKLLDFSLGGQVLNYTLFFNSFLSEERMDTEDNVSNVSTPRTPGTPSTAASPGSPGCMMHQTMEFFEVCASLIAALAR